MSDELPIVCTLTPAAREARRQGLLRDLSGPPGAREFIEAMLAP